MLFTEKGDKSLPTIILLHGNGLSDWSWDRVVKELQEEYHIVTPIIDGHGEDFETEFTSIEDLADKLIQYIDRYQYGKVFAIGGCTLGAQIVIDILSKRNDIAQYAIIESPLIYPIKLPSSTMNSLSFKVAYKLAKKSWFAKLQAKSLNIPKELYDKFFEDNKKITKTSILCIFT